MQEGGKAKRKKGLEKEKKVGERSIFSYRQREENRPERVAAKLLDRQL